MRVVLNILIGQYHPTMKAMREINEKILDRETNLKEYNPQDHGLKARIPASITHCLQIRLSY